MPRIQFSDVTPPDNRRSIRDIPIPNGGKRKMHINVKPEIKPVSNFDSVIPNIPKEIPKKENNAYEYYPKNKEEPTYDSNSKKSRKKARLFGGAIFVLIVFFIVGMMTVFASATVDIVPRSENIAVSTEITSTTEMATESVRYEVVKLTKSKTISIPATGEEAVELKASGKIIVYNNFSTSPQRLIIRTRFETKEGLIFRIPESIVVPGKTTKNGIETPGSIEVEVFADEPGEKYNIDKTDFTIPGFKSDKERYNNFYARSSTEMTGGFVGKMKTVLPADKQAALQNIDNEIQADLEKELQSKVPAELVLLSNSIIYKSKELAPKEESSAVLVGKDITAYAIMLNKKELSDKIVTTYASEFDDWNDIKSQIIDFSPLTVEKIVGNPETGDKISIQIKGQITAWAEINTTIISERLPGAPKGDLQKIMDEFAGISSIKATIRPVWKQTFPSSSSKIHIQTSVTK